MSGTGLALALTMMIALAPRAFADTSGNLVLQGRVPRSLRLSAAVTSNTILPDRPGGQGGVTVALISEYSNSAAGYTITLSSENARDSDQFFLEREGSSPQGRLPYVLACDGTPVRLRAGAAVIADAAGPTPAAGTLRRLTVTLQAEQPYLEVGGYEDTLVITVAAK